MKRMRFRSLCSRDEFSASGVGRISAEIRTRTEDAFRGYVLPHRTREKPTFTADDCHLYVPLRDWAAAFPKPEGIHNENYLYETLIDSLFWEKDWYGSKYDSRKVLFVTGSVGSGKSTFVDYYLRCFCPNESDKKDAYSEKLILHLDLKGRQTASDLDLRIWRELQKSLRRANVPLKSIGRMAERITPTQSDILYALEDLAEYAKGDENRAKKYIVMVFDNIDQSPEQCQRHCLSYISEIVEEDSDLEVWKVIFPMWPETLNRLGLKSGFASKGVEYHELDLGNINLKEFYEKRREALEGVVRTEGSESSKRILEEVQNLTDKRYSEFLRDLTYGNMIALDKIVIGLLLSEETQMHQRYSGSHQMSEYRFFDSMICGTSRYHNRFKSSILNPFALKGRTSDVRQVFVTTYLIFYLEQSDEHSSQELLDFFQRYGFRKSLVREALSLLERFNLLHMEPNSVVNPHRSSLHAYSELINEPAVIDNFAHTTQIIESNISRRWKKTKGYDPSQFLARCETTNQFFDAMVGMENIIDSKIQSSGKSVQNFRDTVRKWTPNARGEYRERLLKLREIGWPEKARVSDDQWDNLLK